MKRREVIKAKNSLEAAKDAVGMKFRYAYWKNLKKLESELEVYEGMRKPSEDYTAYEKALYELKVSHAKKVPGTDHPVIENNNFVMGDMDAFLKDYQEFQRSHQETIDEYDALVKKFNEYMEGEAEIEFHKVPLEDFPENLTAGQFSALDFMIQE